MAGRRCPVAAALPGVEVIGVDPAGQRTRVSAANAARLGLANASFVTGDAAALPFADASFDLITAASALEEAAEPEAVFAELRRVLREGCALRASYQDWRLAAPEIETVLLWDGVARQGRPDATPVRLYTYVHRLQDPAIERRWTLELPAEGEAAQLHQRALEGSAAGRRAYGETLLTPVLVADLGVPLLERLVPLARRRTVVEMRRWTTEWLVESLEAAGFREVRLHGPPGRHCPPRRARAHRARRRGRRRAALRCADDCHRRRGRPPPGPRDGGGAAIAGREPRATPGR